MTFGVREIITLLAIAVCGLAIGKGGAPERLGGFFVLAAWGALLVTEFVTRSGAPSVDIVAAVGLVEDIALACGFLALALKFSSLWLAAAMMLQAMQLALYGSFLAHGATHSHNSYAVASNIESVLLLLVIFAATLGSWRKRVIARRASTANLAPLAA